MYCYHCGYKLDETKVKSADPEELIDIEQPSFDAEVRYICPRCGHLIHEGLTTEDSKELSRASHAQIQRGNNSVAVGMCMNALGVILFLIGLLFYILAKKPAQGFVLQTNCPEFYVSLVLIIVSVILLGFGITKTIIGARTKNHYTKLLKDINNQTFIQ